MVHLFIRASNRLSAATLSLLWNLTATYPSSPTSLRWSYGRLLQILDWG